MYAGPRYAIGIDSRVGTCDARRETSLIIFDLNLSNLHYAQVRTKETEHKTGRSSRSIFVIISFITGSLNAGSADSINSATSAIPALRFSPALHVYHVTGIAAGARERKIRNDRVSDFFRYYFIIIFATSGAVQPVAGPLHT